MSYVAMQAWGVLEVRFSLILSHLLFSHEASFFPSLFPSLLSSLSVSLSPLYFSPSICPFIYLPPSFYINIFSISLSSSLSSLFLSLSHSIIPSFSPSLFSSHLFSHFFPYSLLSNLFSSVVIITPPLPSATILTLFCTLPNPIQLLHDATHLVSTDLLRYHMAILFYPILLIMHHASLINLYARRRIAVI